MKDKKLVDKKAFLKNYKEINSPMKTLFRLTVNIKKSKNTLFEKRTKPSSSSTILNNNKNQLNKISSAKNINENKYSSSIFGKNNRNNSLVNIKDNNYTNKNINATFYDEYMHNENNFIYDNNNYNEFTNYGNNNYINSKKEDIISNNEMKKGKNMKQIKKEMKDEKIKNDKTKNNLNNKGNNNYIEDTQKNIHASTGMFNYKINEINKKKNNNIRNDLNNKILEIQRNKSKNNIQEIEMPFKNSDSNYVNMNNLKINNALYSSENQYYKNNNREMYNDVSSETIQPEEYYLNRYNFGNNNNIINPNQNIIFNIKKQNIKKVNNILINTKEVPNDEIYSPKRGLARIYSQENIVNKDKDIEKINSITEYRIIYKNKSLKDLSGFTYTKKNNLQKTRNTIIKNKKNSIDEKLPKNKYINKYFSNSCYNSISDLGEKNNFNENENLITKRGEDYLDEKKYDIEPDIYPEIKINLRNRYNKHINKSVILNDKKRFNINNSICSADSNNDNNLYSKYSRKKSNSIDENSNTHKNINRSFLSNSNINSSVICQNANISIINNTYSDRDAKKPLNYNMRKQLLTKKDFYLLLILEEKIKDLSEALVSEKMKIICNYCFELINYVFSYSIDKLIEKTILDKIEVNNILIYNNYTIFSIIILYDLTYDDKTYSNVKILIKEIMKLIYSNIILIINHSKKLISKSEENISDIYHIINNVQNKYIHNKELYIDDNEYLLMDQNMHLSFEEKIDYNINFIIRNIHTIINNMKNSKNLKNFSDLFKKLININFEEINQFFRDKVLRINIINSSFLYSKIFNKNYNFADKIIPPYINSQCRKKFSLVISLDDTLIHFKTGSIKNNKGVVQLRPGLTEFFDSIKPYYEIIIFSSGNKKYSDLIINSIDDKKMYIDYRLYREHCIVICNDFVKDISRIGRPLNKIVIVDNIYQNFRLHQDNGINIKSFYGDKPNDRILFYLSKILVNIARYGGDIREGIKKYWNDIINKISSNIYINYYCK